MRTSSWRLGGGLDLTTPAIARSRNPGSLIGCLNYEARREGYRRIDGYERFDGQRSPSDVAALPEDRQAAASESRRRWIQEVPGTGEVLGVWRYQNRTYAFRRGQRGAVRMYASGSGGWRAVGLGADLTAPEDARFRFVNHNFRGQAHQERMYGVSGAGPAFEFDGRTYSEIHTGVSGVYPVLIAAHQNHLFLGYADGSVIHSALGEPRNFQALGGAAELAIGDELTGMLSGYRDTMFLFGRNKTLALRGTSAADWHVETISSEAGAMRYTAVLMDQPLSFDDRGLRSLAATEAYGDFSIATLTERVRPWLDYKRKGGALPSAAARVRSKSQYRLFFDDGECLVMAHIPRSGGGLSREFTIAAYDLQVGGGTRAGVVTNICSVEDPDGRERIFCTLAGSGYVYEMDRGTSFDGYPVPAYVRLAYNDLRTPHIIKRFRKLQLECDSTFRSTFRVTADFDDDMQEGDRPGESFSISGPPSRWDEDEWSDFDWDGTPARVAHARIAGRGRNISPVLYSEQSDQPPHVFTGLTVYYDNRKQAR